MYDVIILGGGPAGYHAALALAKSKKKSCIGGGQWYRWRVPKSRVHSY